MPQRGARYAPRRCRRNVLNPLQGIATVQLLRQPKRLHHMRVVAMCSIPFRGLQRHCRGQTGETFAQGPLVAMCSIPFRGLQLARPRVRRWVVRVVVALCSIPFRGLPLDSIRPNLLGDGRNALDPFRRSQRDHRRCSVPHRSDTPSPVRADRSFRPATARSVALATGRRLPRASPDTARASALAPLPCRVLPAPRTPGQSGIQAFRHGARGRCAHKTRGFP